MTPGAIDDLIERMDALLGPMEVANDDRRHFLSVYARTTRAVKADLALGRFLDAEWVERWDIAFANLYLDALETWNRSHTAPGPWRTAFEGGHDATRIPPLRHLLLGMNAHINYDLPQALIAVISD